MNRIHNPHSVSALNAPGCFFMLGVLLAGPALQSARAHAAPEAVPSLDNRIAARLLIHIASPDYPAVAKINLIQGVVKLQIIVSREGKVTSAHVLDGQPMLAAAAIAGVREWLYRPYESPRGAEPFSTEVEVKFQLNNHNLKDRPPQNAEDFLEKQIHPPEVISRPQPEPSLPSVRFKVLIDSKGEVLDATALEPQGAGADLARENLRRWKFRPARWGAIPVAWYITVDVPVGRAQAANLKRH